MTIPRPDPTKPGPAGLYPDRSRLLGEALARDIAIGASLERWCAYCGQVSTYGFGEFRGQTGILTCADPDYMAQGKAAAAERARAVAEPVTPVVAAPVRPEPCPAPVLDLFGEAA